MKPSRCVVNSKEGEETNGPPTRLELNPWANRGWKNRKVGLGKNMGGKKKLFLVDVSRRNAYKPGGDKLRGENIDVKSRKGMKRKLGLPHHPTRER